MLTCKLSSEQEEIIKDICDEQIRTLIGTSIERIDEITCDEQTEGIGDLLKSFSDVKSKPSTVFNSDEYTYSLFKHSLLHNEERYFSLKIAIANLWNKIIVRDNFNMVMS